LHRASAVRYRQEVCQDLDDDDVAECMRAFAERMRRARSFLRGHEPNRDPSLQARVVP
jgi:hypothetical protein